MDNKNQWPKVLEHLREQVTAANYRTWFAKTTCQEKDDGGLIIKVPSVYIKEQLQTKLNPTLIEALTAIFGNEPAYEFKVDSSLDGKKTESEGIELQFNPPVHTTTNLSLNPKYNLENFVVGFSNQLAFAAAQAVVKNPGVSYNPLFVYGGTGVGKTHLMQGIGNALLKTNSRLKIIYCSAEKFMNDFVQGIQTKQMSQFRARYRAADLLLIDDIQFISGRDSIQEEFFHTFNDLQTKNSQIVLTSDRPPGEIQKLEGRLASRFQGGLMVDIQQPDFDTRIAILKAKCGESGDLVSEECLILIAENMPTNARELEGKLIQIVQSCKLVGEEVNLDTVRKYLGQLPQQPQKLDHKKVITGINQYFNIKMADIIGPRRKKELVLPRQLAMYVLYEDCKLPFERIGDLLGGRDHTTIMHGVEKIKEAVGRDREVQRMLIEIKQSLIN